MKICILHIGHTDPDSVSVHPPSPERFKSVLDPLIPGAVWTTVSAVTDPLPTNPEFDAFLITGGKYSVFDPLSWQDRLFKFIDKIMEDGIPLAGICYGHQAIARVLGGKVERSEKGYGVGLMPVSVVADMPWSSVTENPLMLHAMHQDQVSILPEGAELFMSSEFCPISGFSFNNKVLAIQHHPDFTPALNRDLIQKRRDKIGEQKAKAAIASLTGRDDTDKSVEFLVKFFNHAIDE